MSHDIFCGERDCEHETGKSHPRRLTVTHAKLCDPIFFYHK